MGAGARAAGERGGVNAKPDDELRALRAENDALRACNASLMAAVEVIDDAVFIKGEDGRYRMINAAGAGLLGRSAAEVIGEDDAALFEAETARRVGETDRAIVAEGTTGTYEGVATSSGITPTPPVTKGPLRDGSGRVIGAVGISRDIAAWRRNEAVGGISFDVTARERAEESLEESRRRMRALFDNTRDAMWLLDDEGRFVDANPAVCALLGYTREEFLRMRLEDVATAEEQVSVRELWGTILAAGQLSGEFTQVRKDGETRVVDYRAVANILPGLHLSVNRDITERKRAERELRETDEQVRLLLDSTGEAICGVDLENRCTFCNAACLRLLGYADQADLLGQEMHGLIHHTRPDGKPHPSEACRIFSACLRGEGTHAEDEVLWRADGTSFPAEYWSHPIRRGGEVVGSVITFVDISERCRVEEELRESTRGLQVLSRRLVEVQEEERRHLARELHDEIGQALTAIGIGLQAVKKARPGAVASHLDECIGLVDRAIRQVRHLSLDLRPSMLDDLGLVATLRWYVDRQAQRVGYRARFISDADEIRLDPAVATAVFRVAQEALTNVARHARARLVRVSVRRRGCGLRLVVRDDGVGFDSGATRRGGSRFAGLGLLGMRERAALLGGRIDIRSQPGRGTRVRLTVPLGPTEGGV
ncbi:MAG TPA: PAS domain S-box protein [Isosphaeraceae bacterium]